MAMEQFEGELLNEHGKYVLQYAKNHGISIDEAYKAPMVKAHLEYFNAVQDGRVGSPWLIDAT